MWGAWKLEMLCESNAHSLIFKLAHFQIFKLKKCANERNLKINQFGNLKMWGDWKL